MQLATRQMVEERLVVGICGARKTCRSPACIAARGRVGDVANGVNLHLQYAEDHDKAPGRRAVIPLSMGKVVP
jgi:hypothetical protein